MASSHDTLRSLILTYEELAPDQKAEADAHRATCAECRRLFDQLALADSQADVRVEVPGGNPSARQLERIEAFTAPRPGGTGATGRRLEERVPLNVVMVDVPEQVRKLPRWALIAIPAAVALVLILVFALVQGQRPAPPIVKNLRIVPFASVASAKPGWHTGQAFALEFRLVKRASLVVFHVDPSGYADLLYPADPGARIEPMPAGDVRLPPEGTQNAWRFEGGPGPEAYLVAAMANQPTSVSAVVEEIRSVPLWAGRPATISGLKALLERRVGPCALVEIDHQP